MTLKLTINDRQIEASEGQTILEAARSNGMIIPTLCYHKDLSPAGSCRICIVEVDQIPGQVSACTLPVREGMVVYTETPALVRSRRMVLTMLLRTYVDTTPKEAADDRDDTEFMYWVRYYDVRLPDGVEPIRRYVVDSDPNPFIRVDLNTCILCTRCVRACAEVQGRFVWGVAERGLDSRIIAGADTSLLDARCESCGACVAYCPTGALDDRMSIGLGQPDTLVTTTCAYCGVGCQLNLNVKDNRIIRVTSHPDAPVNGMALCVKGRYGYDFVHHPDRVQAPRVRRYLLEGSGIRDRASGRGEWVEVDWETALRIVAEKLVAVKRESSSDAIGVLTSAKCTNEENYLMQKFARQVIGTHNVDHCARLCHSSTVAGLAMCFGSGAMSNTMDDIATHARAIFIIGSNTTEQHPVFGTKIRQAVLRRGVKLVVADPRRIDITEFATLHIRQRPGTDVALINGIMHIILKNRWYDQSFIDQRCEGFEEFRTTVELYTPEIVLEVTGVSVNDLHRVAEILSLNRPMATIWAMGITQHTTGVMNVLSLGNLQMLLGNMGRAGGGVNPLRGQNNVQGACDMGALPNVFPGYQPVTDTAVRETFAAAWRLTDGRQGGGSTQWRVVDRSGGPMAAWNGKEETADGRNRNTDHSAFSLFSFRNKPGLTVTEMIPLAGEGRIRALYILGEDPILTDPDANHVRKCLDACEFIVLQEIFPSETSGFADVLLPGVSFAEKDGTFTNTERRIQMVHKAIEPPGQARQDWAITTDLAKKMMHLEDRLPLGPHAGWDYASPAQIMDEIAALTPIYAGISYARLERGDQLRWPVRSADHPGTPILHVGQFTRGKGRFHAIDHLPPQELPDDEYPILLTTGRVLYHWHGGEITRRAAGLLEVYPESLVEISPDDAAKIGLNGQTMVRVVSRRGEVTAKAIITDRVPSGVIFANFHFPGVQNANNLTIAALDPIAKIPEYKVCAVKVECVGA
ncbi:MAG: molybdopterin-dependent oxidoreductase [Candidatus Latescibacteria bacterium]|nr:molybdopterin-dependent oxidoreductase [Candidatus Latescibacterota bacterium]